MIVPMSDRKQIGVRLRGERAPRLWDEGCDGVKAQIASMIPLIGGAMGEKRSEIVGSLVIVALMKCRTKTAASRTEAVGRRGEGRR